MWATTYRLELKWQSSTWRHLYHHKNTQVGKIHHPHSWHTASKVLLWVNPFYGVKLWVHRVTSHLCSSNYIVQLRRSIQNWLKMPSSYVIMLPPTQHTHTHTHTHTLTTFYHGMGWEVLQQPPCSPELSPCDYDLIQPLMQPLQKKLFANREDIWTAGWNEVAWISMPGGVHRVLHFPHHCQQTADNPRDVVKQPVQTAWAILFHPCSLPMPQYKNDLWFKTCGLLASYHWFLYIFSHLMVTCHMRSNVHIQFHVSTFLAPKKRCHDLQNGLHIHLLFSYV
jgi:hypothetical protein